jgi:hypothetical protein
VGYAGGAYGVTALKSNVNVAVGLDTSPRLVCRTIGALKRDVEELVWREKNHGKIVPRNGYPGVKELFRCSISPTSKEEQGLHGTIILEAESSTRTIRRNSLGFVDDFQAVTYNVRCRSR